MDREKRPTEAGTIGRNIAAIAAIETQAVEARSRSERLGDIVNEQAGQIWFLLVHVGWFGTWIGLNIHLLPPEQRFDPFPFPLLTLVVSLEAIFLSLFILISQNRSMRHAEHRSHWDLQINLLTEAEITKLVSMVHALCKAQGLPEGDDSELDELECETRPENLSRDLKTALPGQ